MLFGRNAVVTIGLALACVTATAQQPPPRPFPEPRPPAPANVAPSQPTMPAQRPAVPRSGAQATVPNEASLGAPIYPTAQFITSYDAGRDQRFYLFGTVVPFAEIVAYYRTTLKSRGEVLFETPPTYQFEIGRFREQTMAFPPSVTIKDYTWGGSAGYRNPKRGAKPERFPTIIQIVPAPPEAQD